MAGEIQIIGGMSIIAIAVIVTIFCIKPKLQSGTIQALIGTVYFTIAFTAYLILLKVFFGVDSTSNSILYNVQITSILFLTWLGSTTYLSNFFANNE
jgi:predicted anti-sigma-YlaC factor YlaD